MNDLSDDFRLMLIKVDVSLSFVTKTVSPEWFPLILTLHASDAANKNPQRHCTAPSISKIGLTPVGNR